MQWGFLYVLGVTRYKVETFSDQGADLNDVQNKHPPPTIQSAAHGLHCLKDLSTYKKNLLWPREGN